MIDLHNPTAATAELEAQIKSDLVATEAIFKEQIKCLYETALDDGLVVIYPHVRADGDALGACIGFALILKAAGFDVIILSEEPIAEKFSYLSDMAVGLFYPVPESIQVQVDHQNGISEQYASTSETTWKISVATANESELASTEETKVDSSQAMSESLSHLNSILKRQVVGIALDSPGADRLGRRENMFEYAPRRFIIDHHPAERQLDQYYAKRTTASAVCEMIVDFVPLLEKIAGKSLVTPEIATCLLTGILTDTGRFSYTNTTSHTLESAAAMLRAGAQIRELTAHLFDTMSPARMQLIGLMAQRLTYYAGGKLAVSYFEQNDFDTCGAVETDTDGLVGMLREVAGVDVSLLLQVTDTGDLRCSLRSSDRFNVGQYAETMGGGGHRAAAGFTLFEMSLEQGLRQLTEHLTQQLEELRLD